MNEAELYGLGLAIAVLLKSRAVLNRCDNNFEPLTLTMTAAELETQTQLESIKHQTIQPIIKALSAEGCSCDWSYNKMQLTINYLVKRTPSTFVSLHSLKQSLSN